MDGHAHTLVLCHVLLARSRLSAQGLICSSLRIYFSVPRKPCVTLPTQVYVCVCVCMCVCVCLCVCVNGLYTHVL